jgi:hypothetical protein
MQIDSDFSYSHMAIPQRGPYADDETDHRVTAVLFYAAGMARHHIPPEILFDRIERLYDRKGSLYVVCWKPLGDDVEYCFRKAWEEIGNEPAENVTFRLHGDDEFDVWPKRRFGPLKAVE